MDFWCDGRIRRAAPAAAQIELSVSEITEFLDTIKGFVMIPS